MSKINVISGFLGAGKTTLIKKLLSEAYQNEQVVLIENEFGEIGIDGGFLKEAGIQITEMNSGCICCSLTGDFKIALKKVEEEYHPDRILIEPSGVGKLSDVLKAVEECADSNIVIGCGVAVVDGLKYNMYSKNFGEFFNDQIENAAVIILSRTQKMNSKDIDTLVEKIKEANKEAIIITTPWDEIKGNRIAEVLDAKNLEIDMHEHHHHEDDECCCGHHHNEEHEHHHHHEESECCCGHHHDEEHEHHHHEDDECCCGHHHNEEHEHHHHEDGECCCGHHHNEEHEHHHHEEGECCCGHHHGHDADEIFTSIGFETTKQFTKEELSSILNTLSEDDEYGVVLRSKGIVKGEESEWYYFDMVPEEQEIRLGEADYTGRIVVIGSGIKEEKIKELFIK